MENDKVDKLRELFKIDHELKNYKKDNINLGLCWVNKSDGSYLCSNEDVSILFFDFLLDYKINTFNYKMGFSEENQKWYGWSHRAIYGFGIGSKVKPGDIAFQPLNEEEFVEQKKNFWFDPEMDTEDSYKELVSVETKVINPEDSSTGNRLGCTITIKQHFRGKQSQRESYVRSYWSMYPLKFGRGSWEAKTLEDAKEMANAFAEGVN